MATSIDLFHRKSDRPSKRMSLIHLYRNVVAARQSLADRLHGRNVIFIHIPKCGGTSINRGLRRAYCLSQAQMGAEETRDALALVENTTSEGEIWQKMPKYRAFLAYYLLLKQTKCLVGHFHFEDTLYETFRGDYAFMTMLRDPVDRFLSHFYFHLDTALEKQCPNGRLEEFIEGNSAREFGSMMTQFLSGLPMGSDFHAAEAVEAAKANLDKFDIVGLLDELPDFQQQVSDRLGTRLRIGHQNVGQNRRGSTAEVSPDIMARVRTLCAPDQALYDFAKARRQA